MMVPVKYYKDPEQSTLGFRTPVEFDKLLARIIETLREAEHVYVEHRGVKYGVDSVSRRSLLDIEIGPRVYGNKDDFDSIVERLVDANPSIHFIDLIGA